MKLPLLALLCAGTAALCQSPPQSGVDPDKLFQMPDKFMHPMSDFTTFKQPPAMKNELVLAFPRIVLPPPKLNDPRSIPGSSSVLPGPAKAMPRADRMFRAICIRI